jgi:hypothetical protein
VLTLVGKDTDRHLLSQGLRWIETKEEDQADQPAWSQGLFVADVIHGISIDKRPAPLFQSEVV